MIKFLFKISIYLLALILFSLIVEFYITEKIKHGYRYYFQADWHDLKNHNSDILFIGNSRTYVHLDPFKIQKRFNVKCEILAEDGQGVQLLWLKFKEYTKSNINPDEIYLQFDPFFIIDRKELYGVDNFRTGFFLNRIDLSSLKNIEGFNILYNYVPLLAIDFNLFKKVIFNDTISKVQSYENTHGFQGQERIWEGNWRKPEKIIIPKYLDSFSSYIDSFVIYSKKNNIKLYSIYSPQSSESYKNIENPILLSEKVNKLSNFYKYPIEYLNFNSDSLYDDSTLFYNHMHLNNKGIKVFMKQLLLEERAFKKFR